MGSQAVRAGACRCGLDYSDVQQATPGMFTAIRLAGKKALYAWAMTGIPDKRQQQIAQPDRLHSS